MYPPSCAPATDRTRAVVDAVLEADAELDVFDAAALGRTDRLTELLDDNPELAKEWASDGFIASEPRRLLRPAPGRRPAPDRGADVSAVSRNAMEVQPLHAATAARNAEIVTLLLDAGADPDARQHGGWTPLAAARHSGQDAIADILLAHGADPSTADGPPTSTAAADGDADKSATLTPTPRPGRSAGPRRSGAPSGPAGSRRGTPRRPTTALHRLAGQRTKVDPEAPRPAPASGAR